MTQQAKPSPATAGKWAALAEEAIADAGEWKRQCREAQDLNRELLAALKHARAMLASAELYGGSYGRAAKAQHDTAITKAEGR